MKKVKDPKKLVSKATNPEVSAYGDGNGRIEFEHLNYPKMTFGIDFKNGKTGEYGWEMQPGCSLTERQKKGLVNWLELYLHDFVEYFTYRCDETKMDLLFLVEQSA